MGHAEFLLFASVVILTAGRSEAVSCYQCQYTNSSDLSSSNCTEPFNGTSVMTCSAPICFWKVSSYTNSTINSTDYIVINRGCIDGDAYKNTSCDQYAAMTNSSYFVSGESCCFPEGQKKQDGLNTNQTVCFCKVDKCNGNVFNATSSSTNKVSSSAKIEPLLFKWASLLAICLALAF